MRAVPRLAVLLFTRIKASSMENKQISQTFKKASKSVYGMVSPDHLSPPPATFSAMKISENTEENHDDPEPADERDNLYPSD
jgi:hypothetical protein